MDWGPGLNGKAEVSDTREFMVLFSDYRSNVTHWVTFLMAR